jgi:hypothetical protein
MNVSRILISCYSGILLYLILVFFLGPNGVVSYGELAREKVALTENLNRLENSNSDLGRKIAALTGNRQVLVRESQKLGYFPPKMNTIRFKDYDAQLTYYNAGSLLHIREKHTVPVWLFRLASLVAACSVYVMLNRGFPSSRRKRRP